MQWSLKSLLFRSLSLIRGFAGLIEIICVCSENSQTLDGADCCSQGILTHPRTYFRARQLPMPRYLSGEQSKPPDAMLPCRGSGCSQCR